MSPDMHKALWFIVMHIWLAVAYVSDATPWLPLIFSTAALFFAMFGMRFVTPVSPPENSAREP